jgi:CheY-like chemotaxis protein
MDVPGSTEDTLPPIVLLVERDADTRDMYEAALGLEGLWTAHASEPADAFAYAVELRPDAIVTEVRLTGNTDGLELARRLRAEPRTANIPVLAVTSSDVPQPGSGAEVFETVLIKPVPPALLVDRLRGALDRSRVLRAHSEAILSRVPTILETFQERLAQAQIGRAELTARLSPESRCPRCGAVLEWVERRELASVVFDYFRPCPKGCGLFCFDRSLQRWIALVE